MLPFLVHKLFTFSIKSALKIAVNQIRRQFRGVSFVTWSSHQVHTSINIRYYSLRTQHTSVKNK